MSDNSETIYCAVVASGAKGVTVAELTRAYGFETHVVEWHLMRHPRFLQLSEMRRSPSGKDWRVWVCQGPHVGDRAYLTTRIRETECSPLGGAA